MLTFTQVRRLVEEQLTALSADPNIASALRSYRSKGGDQTEDPWRVAGIYAYETKDQRLVLEAFYLAGRDTCVVRVFRESRPEILYARKSVGDTIRLASLLDEAAADFLLHLKKWLPLQSSEAGYGLISKLIGKSLSRALAPIPPPVNLDIES